MAPSFPWVGDTSAGLTLKWFSSDFLLHLFSSTSRSVSWMGWAGSVRWEPVLAQGEQREAGRSRDGEGVNRAFSLQHSSAIQSAQAHHLMSAWHALRLSAMAFCIPSFILWFWASVRRSMLIQMNTSCFCDATNCSFAFAIKMHSMLTNWRLKWSMKPVSGFLNSLALEAVQMRLKNKFHGNPNAQACTHCPAACQQHSYSLEDIFLMGVDLPKVYYTFSGVEHAFISVSVEGLLWIIFFNFSIIPSFPLMG